jgi:hypothetical protein
MRIDKLAFATLVAMGMTEAAIAQQPGQQTQPRQSQPQTQQPGQQTQPRQQQPGASQSQAPRGGDRTEQMSFERADKNADGRVSREEGNAIEGFDFSRADTNNDASLSRQEYQAAMATSTPREGAGGRSEPGAGGGASARSGPQSDQAGGGSRQRDRDESDAGQRGGSQQSAQVSFDTADKNKDGKISRDEAEDVRGLNFTSADVNSDASLSRQEFQTAMAGAQPRG